MKVDIKNINRIFGDRVLVRRLERPTKMRGILVPESYLKEKRKEQSIWFGVIEKFGLDSKYMDAYNLKEGDIVGISDIANSNASFEGQDGNEHFWIMEEFIAFVDSGRIQAFNNDELFGSLGIVPLGSYSVVHPYPEEDKIGSIILPKTQENLTGKVLAVSIGEIKDNNLYPIRVNVDSDILFGKYSSLSLKLGNDKLLLIKEEDIIAEFNKSKVEVMELCNA